MEKRQCPSCGALISSAAIYCLDCGQRVDGKRSILDNFTFGEEKAPAPPPAEKAAEPKPAPAPHPEYKAPEQKPAPAPQSKTHAISSKAHELYAKSRETLAKAQPSPPPLPSPSATFSASAPSVLSVPSVLSDLPDPAAPRPLCPRCKTQLALRDHGDYATHDCQKCSGSFADLLQTQRIQSVTPKTPPVEDVYLLRNTVMRFRNDGKVLYAACPICGVTMSRVNFGGVSGIVLVRCEHHGTWFDAEEIAKLRAFIMSGGLVLAKLEEQQRHKRVVKQDSMQQLQDTIRQFFGL